MVRHLFPVARGPVADRAIAAALGALMVGELLWLATGWEAMRPPVYLAVLAVLVTAFPRLGLREAYLLSLCGVLSALAIATADPLGVLRAGLDQAAFLMAFVALIGLIQQAAGESESVRQCGLYLTRQPAGRRYLSVFLGTHVMAQLFNLGVINLLAPLIRGGSTANDGDPLQPIRERRQITAMLRGFAWCVVWSPTAVAPLVLMTLLPEAKRAPWVGMGLVIAGLAMVLGWLEDRWTFRKARRDARGRVSAQPRPMPLAAFAEFLSVCAALAGGVIVIMLVFDGSVVFGLMVASPAILLGWLLYLQRGNSGAALNRARVLVNGYLPGVARIAVTLGCSGFIGRSAAVLIPTERWAEAAGVAQMPGWLFLLVLSVGIAVLSQLALSPIMMAVFFGSLIAELPELPADVTWAALAISCGWALSMLASPFATVVLVTEQATGHGGMTLTWRWNWRYTLLCTGLLAAVYWALTAGG